MLNAGSIDIWFASFCDFLFLMMMNAKEHDEECLNFAPDRVLIHIAWLLHAFRCFQAMSQ